jgi:hypothetical protein
MFLRAAITFGLAVCLVIFFIGAVVTDVLARGSRGSSGSHHSSGSRSSGFHSGLGTGSNRNSHSVSGYTRNNGTYQRIRIGIHTPVKSAPA